MSESSLSGIVPAGIDIEAVAYVVGWKEFTNWCIDNRSPGLPAAPADVGCCLEYLVEMKGKSLTTVHLRPAAIAGPTA